MGTLFNKPLVPLLFKKNRPSLLLPIKQAMKQFDTPYSCPIVTSDVKHDTHAQDIIEVAMKLAAMLQLFATPAFSFVLLARQ